MGLRDILFGKKQQPQVNPEPVPHKLDLSKDIDESFKKLDLDKPDVLEETVFVLDVSGSMDGMSGKQRKIDHLRDVMSKYPTAHKVCFSDDVYLTQDIPEPRGGTSLDKTFRYLAKTNNFKKIVLVSDGEPNDEGEALNEAVTLGAKVDIVFIGTKGSRGERFMERLAERTGGIHFIV